MPPRRRFKCHTCHVDFSTHRGLQVHHGRTACGEWHPPEAPEGRWTLRGADAPMPPAFPPMHGVAEEDDDGLADMDAQDGEDGEDGLHCAAEEEPGDLDEARAYARRMLRAPGWEQWAEDTLEWCEVNHLHEVEKLFPAEADFTSPETFRYLRLVHQHPGATFASALLKANLEQTLDLDKVVHLALMCGSFAHLLVKYDRHMTGIFCQASRLTGKL